MITLLIIYRKNSSLLKKKEVERVLTRIKNVYNAFNPIFSVFKSNKLFSKYLDCLFNPIVSRVLKFQFQRLMIPATWCQISSAARKIHSRWKIKPGSNCRIKTGKFNILYELDTEIKRKIKILPSYKIIKGLMCLVHTARYKIFAN